MKLFYHHVGKVGSQEDFKKTVFKRVPISILNTIPPTEPYRNDIIQSVRAAFPDGSFNCWGVPSGADSVVRRLEVGDAVLLVETVGEFGNIPVLGIVSAFWKCQLRDLSEALWGESKYPYVFFFNTETIDLTWEQFLNDVGFKENFNPRGKFYSVKDKSLDSFGGVSKYVDHLRQPKAAASSR
jgi:5-methylcytosine-specific restriction protein A